LTTRAGDAGNVPETFAKALAALTIVPDAHSVRDNSIPAITLLKKSRNFSTQPIGAQAGNPFINAVALLDAASAEA